MPRAQTADIIPCIVGTGALCRTTLKQAAGIYFRRPVSIQGVTPPWRITQTATCHFGAPPAVLPATGRVARTCVARTGSNGFSSITQIVAS